MVNAPAFVGAELLDITYGVLGYTSVPTCMVYFLTTFLRSVVLHIDGRTIDVSIIASEKKTIDENLDGLAGTYSMHGSLKVRPFWHSTAKTTVAITIKGAFIVLIVYPLENFTDALCSLYKYLLPILVSRDKLT